MTATAVEPQVEQAFGRMASLRLDERGPLWGESAERFQVEDAMAILDTASPVRRHFLTRPKGGRKSADVAAVVLTVLLEQAPPRARLYAAAVDQDQASLLLDTIRDCVASTPRLSQLVNVTSDTVTNLQNGATFQTLAADASGAQGKRPYFLIIEELAEWRDTKLSRRFLTNLLQGAEKEEQRGRWCRVVVLTNAGSPDSLAGELYRTAQASSHWRVREVEGPLPWLTEDRLEALRETCFTPSEFERLHLNRWTTGPDQLTTHEDVAAAMVLQGPQAPEAGRQYVMGVDLGHRRDLAVLAVAHLAWERDVWDRPSSARLVAYVDQLRVWRAPRGGEIDLLEVQRTIAAISAEYASPVFLDYWQAAAIQQDLAGRGIRAETVMPTETSNQKQAMTLYNLLRDRAIRLPADDDLARELASVTLREVRPNVYKFGEQRNDLGHHDRTSAIALACSALMDGKTQDQRRRVVAQRRWAGARRAR